MKRILLTLLVFLVPTTAAAQSVAACDDPKVLDHVQHIVRDMISQRHGPEVAGDVGLTLAGIQTLRTAPDGLSRTCRGVLAVQRRAGSAAAQQYLTYTIETQLGGRTSIRFSDAIFVPPQ
ncbi:hypothetical protein [Megalodesulfovibrio gigas]|uniref:Lipoprotein n=1 Tax=Megalodesulfovibrio gigas (strain ATCC 19364 / DSM 1382 / NCIMB 9332 / VKM B-1759) TaxID=1121448 RepID=T2GFR9_MEGG1|nr:hypothetical protein [Megalodesulfovibrio gigas]AGW14777.1 hypothetical protein DGI_3059 [Megalodesulfovibrio gigas DSM 1382 = ATCC 19364]